MIGSYVHIGERATIGKFSIIKEYVKILPGTVLPPNSVIPAFSIVAGVPGRVVAELGEAATDDLDCRELYRTYGAPS
jgi:dynactin-5